MSSNISKEEVAHVAELAKLKLDDDKLDYFTKQIDDIVGMFETIDKVDTTNIDPTYSVTDQLNTMREDIADNWNQRQALLDTAPETKDGFIEVPTIIDESGDGE